MLLMTSRIKLCTKPHPDYDVDHKTDDFMGCNFICFIYGKTLPLRLPVIYIGNTLLLSMYWLTIF